MEAAAEAFDRQLLYLAAAFDIYGRRFLLLIDPARDPKKSRLSLDAGGYVNDHLVREYPADALAAANSDSTAATAASTSGACATVCLFDTGTLM
ncbi:hypothetical protein RA989_21090, partial [Mycobacteroides abscessus subsp. massiliense]